MVCFYPIIYIHVFFAYLNCHFFLSDLGVDAGEIERLRTQIEELEYGVAVAEKSLKSLQTEQRELEDEAAQLQKQRVG